MEGYINILNKNMFLNGENAQKSKAIKNWII